MPQRQERSRRMEQSCSRRIRVGLLCTANDGEKEEVMLRKLLKSR